jgi:hypothetical protein
MSLDKRVVVAIQEAVRELGESPALAQKIVAWMDSLAEGNARLEDRDATQRQVELLYEEVVSAEEPEPEG